MGFSYKINKKNNHCIVELSGNLFDKASAGELLNEIDNLVAEESKNFILDLSGLMHINSSGLNVLIHILTKSRNAGGEVVISNIPEKIQSLLVMTKLNTVFTVAGNNKLAAGVLNKEKE